MDAARYARMRELFLAAEEMDTEAQHAFLKLQTGGDKELLSEVLSLLAEHDVDLARAEGERAIAVPTPPGAVPSPVKTERDTDPPTQRRHVGSDSTQRGESIVGTQSAKPQSSDITQAGVNRTHASPRFAKDQKPAKAPTPLLWADWTRKSRRQTSRWLWLAALLPTALIGWLTYRQVESAIGQLVLNSLQRVADGVELASERYLEDQAQLVESWSRQTSVRNAVIELVAVAERDDSLDTLRNAPQSTLIMEQLKSLSGHEDVKFVVWDESYKIIASWLPNRADVGSPVHPSGASNLTRVMNGETVLFGPERLTENSHGFEPETEQPVMAIIVPVRDDRSQVVAAMLLRGIGMFENLGQTLGRASKSDDWDIYAVNAAGAMVTNSPNAVQLANEARLDVQANQIAGNLRVADPGMVLTPKNIGTATRNIYPLTVAVASATAGASDVRMVPYRNYAGRKVVGAWRWNETRRLGFIVERDAAQAFAAVSIVRRGFLLLGVLLAVTAFVAAARITKTSIAQTAAVHPLSRYEVVGELGSGGMGVVYRAKHRQLGRDTALKVLRRDRHSQEDRLRFDREARLAASLSNPHSVMIYDYGYSDEGEAYCVMEFLSGLTLREAVARSGFQPVGRVLFILRQICDALAEAHGLNLLHRDIKPQNVMLSLDASVGDWAVVFDYGLAKPLEPDTSIYQTSETIWAGTPMYMAPERFRAPHEIDAKSDIYSVGCVAYYLLAGQPPFIECDPESLFALIVSEQPISIAIHRGEEIPTEVADLVAKCMSKRAEDRFQSVGELSRQIDQLRAQCPWSAEEARQWWDQHGGE